MAWLPTDSIKLGVPDISGSRTEWTSAPLATPALSDFFLNHPDRFAGESALFGFHSEDDPFELLLH
jgi:hypothetical protein